MARSRSRQGRKQFSPQDWEAEVERQKALAAQRRATEAGAQQAQAPAQPAPKPAPKVERPIRQAPGPMAGAPRPDAPARLRPKAVTRDADATHVRIPRFGGRGKLVAAGFAGGAAVGSGGTYAALRHQQQRKNAMAKSLVNPFEEVVVLGKRYPVALPVPGAVKIRALVPTGGHVGHANDLVHVTGRRGAGGRATKLERYRGKGGLQRVGPFGKALNPRSLFGGASSRQFAAPAKPSVQNGLRMVNNMPKLTKLPTALRQPKVNSNIPAGAKRGSSLSRA